MSGVDMDYKSNFTGLFMLGPTMNLVLDVMGNMTWMIVGDLFLKCSNNHFNLSL